MMLERHNNRRPESLRWSTSTTGRKDSRSSSGGGGVISKVLGSFRQKRREEKEKKQRLAEEQRQEWIANFKITHHPDRPRVDKRTREQLSNTEYAAKIYEMQGRNLKHDEPSHEEKKKKSTTRPSLRINVPNFNNSADSPKGTTHSPPLDFRYPSYEKGISPQGDQASSRERSSRGRASSSLVSPGAITIKVFRASTINHGLTKSDERIYKSEEGPILPRRAFDLSESTARQVRRDSGYSRQSNLTDRQSKGRGARNTSSTPPYIEPNQTGPGLILNSSPQPAARPPTVVLEDSDRSSRAPSSSPEPKPKPKTCVMPGCDAPLKTYLEREQNVCFDCRMEYRQSTFDAANRSTRLPAVAEADLETLQALVGGDAKVGITEIQKGPTRIVNSIFNWKLEAPPPGKRRDFPRPQQRNEDQRDISKQISAWSFSTSGQSQQHIGFQDSSWLSSSQETLGAKPQPRPIDERGEEHDSLRTRHRSSGSWTSASPPSGSSSDEDEDEESTSPISESQDEDEDHPYIAPLVYEIKKNNNRPSVVQLERPRQRQQTPPPSRDTVLYQAIDDIIDCYTKADATDAELAERRKTDAISSYYERTPEEVEMRRRGFI